DDDSPLNNTINFSNHITLSHEQSVVSFEYTALSYLAPQKIQYAYKMEGFDHAWNYVGGQKKATYTNIPPGKYIFKVKATDNNGNWNSPAASMGLTILPPFYKTSLAYIIYAILFVVCLLIFRKFSLAQARRK